MTTNNYIVMEMTEGDKDWVHRVLRFEEGSVDVWYIVERGGYVEVIPAKGLECEEPNTRGLLVQGEFDTVALDMIRNGVIEHIEQRYVVQH